MKGTQRSHPWTARRHSDYQVQSEDQFSQRTQTSVLVSIREHPGLDGNTMTHPSFLPFYTYRMSSSPASDSPISTHRGFTVESGEGGGITLRTRSAEPAWSRSNRPDRPHLLRICSVHHEVTHLKSCPHRQTVRPDRDAVPRMQRLAWFECHIRIDQLWEASTMKFVITIRQIRTHFFDTDRLGSLNHSFTILRHATIVPSDISTHHNTAAFASKHSPFQVWSRWSCWRESPFNTVSALAGTQ